MKIPFTIASTNLAKIAKGFYTGDYKTLRKTKDDFNKYRSITCS